MRINKKYFNKLAMEKNISFAGPAPPGCNQKMWNNLINRVPPFNVLTAGQELLRLVKGPLAGSKNLFCNPDSPAFGNAGDSGLNNAWGNVMCMVLFLQFKLFKGLPPGLFEQFSAISNAIAEYMNYVGTPTIAMRTALCGLLNALLAPVPTTIPIAPPRVQCVAEDYMDEPLNLLERILDDLAEAGLITEEGLVSAGEISMTVMVAALALAALLYFLSAAAVTTLIESLFVSAGVTPEAATVIASAMVVAVPTACIAEEIGCGDGPPCEGETPHCCNEECQEVPCEIPDITAYDEHCCLGEQEVDLDPEACLAVNGTMTTEKCSGLEYVK